MCLVYRSVCGNKFFGLEIGLLVISGDNGTILKKDINISDFSNISIKFAIVVKYLENLCHFLSLSIFKNQ